MRWWGPKDFTSPACAIDLCVGGKYLACMRSPEGRDYWSTGVYRAIVPKEKIVYTDNFADAKGNVVRVERDHYAQDRHSCGPGICRSSVRVFSGAYFKSKRRDALHKEKWE